MSPVRAFLTALLLNAQSRKYMTEGMKRKRIRTSELLKRAY